MAKVTKKARERHGELVEEIRRHDRLYYADSAPEIDDRAYDRLFEEIKKLELQHPELVRSDSPTQRVGVAPSDGFVRVWHAERMYSLDNTYSAEELDEFLTRIRTGLGGAEPEYVVEPKLDGASIELIYEGGSLAAALTRGDGVEGEDVAAGIRTIRSLPLGIDETGEVIVRGEVFIDLADL